MCFKATVFNFPDSRRSQPLPSQICTTGLALGEQVEFTKRNADNDVYDDDKGLIRKMMMNLIVRSTTKGQNAILFKFLMHITHDYCYNINITNKRYNAQNATTLQSIPLSVRRISQVERKERRRQRLGETMNISGWSE